MAASVVLLTSTALRGHFLFALLFFLLFAATLGEEERPGGGLWRAVALFAEIPRDPRSPRRDPCCVCVHDRIHPRSVVSALGALCVSPAHHTLLQPFLPRPLLSSTHIFIYSFIGVGSSPVDARSGRMSSPLVLTRLTA